VVGERDQTDVADTGHARVSWSILTRPS
jgi:hypothetical protein